MRLRSALPVMGLVAAAAGCGPAGSGGSVPVVGDWVRVEHPSAWFITFDEDGGVLLRNRTLNETVQGGWAAADSTEVVLSLTAPTHGLPDRLALEVEERGEETLRMSGSDGDAWVLVRYGPVPPELVGRWLTLPRNDPRYFIQFDEPNDVLWRRRFGMRRSEDRIGTGWTRSDSLFLHIWGSPPMHYLYEITGDSLQFERPGIGPFGRYVRAPEGG